MCSGRGVRSQPLSLAGRALGPPAPRVSLQPLGSRQPAARLLTANGCSSNLLEHMSGLAAFDSSEQPGYITLDRVILASASTFALLPSALRPELVAALGRRGLEL